MLDCGSDESISSCAYAREEESKKGMDAAQITGSASSYARKYALNGLFAIDDAKDSDSDENQKESKARNDKAIKEESQQKEKLLKEFFAEIERTKLPVDYFLSQGGVGRPEELREVDISAAIKAMKQKPTKAVP